MAPLVGFLASAALPMLGDLFGGGKSEEKDYESADVEGTQQAGGSSKEEKPKSSSGDLFDRLLGSIVPGGGLLGDLLKGLF